MAGLALENGPNALHFVEKELKPEQGVVLILPQLMVEQIVLEKPVKHKPVWKMNVQVLSKKYFIQDTPKWRSWVVVRFASF